MKRIILASASPRREQLLRQIVKSNFTVIPSAYEEINTGDDPSLVALRNAQGKAGEIASREKGIIIGADSFVWDGRILGKPKDKEMAMEMLLSLSKKEILVYTGLCIIDSISGKALSGVEVTAVKFRAISMEEVAAYVEKDPPMDKAGAFGTSDESAIFIKRIEGDYFNILGLPVCRLAIMLKELGVHVADYW